MYAVVWQYLVKPGAVELFREAYAPGGKWAELFSRSDGYLGTELYNSAEAPERFLTLDRWRSRDAFADFMAGNAAAYAALDRCCADMTTAEVRLGEMEGEQIMVDLRAFSA